MRTRTALGLSVGVLTAANLLNNRIAPRASVVTSVAATGLLLAIARRSGRSWNELGLDRAQAVQGLKYGAIAGAGIGIIYAAGATLPATRALFADQRAASSASGLLHQMLVEVPLGTVLLEEVGFRGVLPALLSDLYGLRVATAVSSGLFGLWHILPSQELVELNPSLAEVSSGGRSRTHAAAGAVVTTGIGGLVFEGLRRRSGSLIAPIMLHTGTNSLGYLAAWIVNRTKSRRDHAKAIHSDHVEGVAGGRPRITRSPAL